MGTESKALQLLKEALEAMREAKPEERSELARRYAVSITELEKVIAYYVVFVASEE
jgi:hypothetical protein